MPTETIEEEVRQLNVRVPKELFAQVKAKCEKQRVSLQELVTQLLSKHVEAKS
jgi:predicted HicB family RNase H-like nuclease